MTIHIEGFIDVDFDGNDYVDDELYNIVLRNIDNKYIGDLASIVANHICFELTSDEFACSKADPHQDDEYTDISMNIPKVSFRVHVTDDVCTLEEAYDKQILASIGELDIYQTWYGYSEWTILGYDLENFKLVSEDGGEHDLKQMFMNYDRKYVHILIDVLE